MIEPRATIAALSRRSHARTPTRIRIHPGLVRARALALLALPLAPGLRVQDPSAGDPLDALRARALRAAPDGALAFVAAGRADDNGLEHGLRFACDPEGRLWFDVDGPCGRTIVWDGERLWTRDQRTGASFEEELWMHDAELAWLAAWTGTWALEGFPLVVAGPGERTGEGPGPSLRLRSPQGSYEGELVLDPETGVARELTTTNWSATYHWTFTDVRDGLARRMVFEDGTGGADTYELATVERTVAPPETFVRPALASHAHIDPEAEPGVPVRKSPAGHLLAEASLDGESVTVVFDTGAGESTIDPAFAERLGLAPYGRARLGGAGPLVKNVHYRRAGALAIGPLTLEDPVFLELAMPAVFQGAVAIVGWDVLVQAVLELDVTEPALRLFDPEHYALAEGEWRELVLHSRHPHTTARFEGHEGLFRLDTGAGRTTVLFHSPAVKALGLLEGRETQPAVATGGAGGQVGLRLGQIAWFELAGRRTENPTVFFCTEERGALADPNALGNLGCVFLSPFVLVLDYRSKRLAFLPR